jgi:hypothetical protein
MAVAREGTSVLSQESRDTREEIEARFPERARSACLYSDISESLEVRGK